MECKQIQQLIEAYDKDELTRREKELFVEHILSCKECQEELEIFYIIEYGLNEESAALDSNAENYGKFIEAYDFKGLVDQKLKDSSNDIQKEKKTRRYMNIAYLTVMVFLLSVIVLYIYMFLLAPNL